MEFPGKCPHCGAQIVFNSSNPISECQYCNSVVILERKKELEENDNSDTTGNSSVNFFSIDGNDVLGAAEQKVKDLAKSFTVREIQSSQKILARYEFGDTHQRGEIWLTDYEIVFKPYKENLGEVSIRYIPYAEICSVSIENSNYFFCKRIAFNLYGEKQIHVHVKILYSNDFIKKIKQRKAYIEKNNLQIESIAYDNKLQGAVNASEAELYKKPKTKFVQKLPSKRFWIATSWIILLVARGVLTHMAERRKLNPNSPAITPEEVSAILIFICIGILGYLIWSRIKHWFKSKLL